MNGDGTHRAGLTRLSKRSGRPVAVGIHSLGKERIQKIIAAEGEFSRREAERLIDEGKVSVNGVVIRRQGVKIDPDHDRIRIAGRDFHPRGPDFSAAILINKPRKVMVTRRDPEGRQTVYELLPPELAGFKPAGRLDYNSQGALILSNDGDLILRLTHPRHELPKVYEVKLSSHPDERQLRRLRGGIVINGERTLPAQVNVAGTRESSTLLSMTITEGRNRQIRNMCEAVGLTVKELRRVAIGPIQLRNLRSGKFRVLTPKEMRELRRAVNK